MREPVPLDVLIAKSDWIASLHKQDSKVIEEAYAMLLIIAPITSTFAPLAASALGHMISFFGTVSHNVNQHDVERTLAIEIQLQQTMKKPAFLGG